VGENPGEKSFFGLRATRESYLQLKTSLGQPARSALRSDSTRTARSQERGIDDIDERDHGLGAA
jgi:hypothetical protein